MSAPYLGDFNTGVTLRHIWSTYSAAGASITRAVNGTVSVYKDNGVTQSTAGITDTEDFDSLTGIHALNIDFSADGAFYSAGSDFTVVLSGATIDGQSVNAVLAHFSIRNRYNVPSTIGATGLAAINAEVVDALNVDTYAEPGQATPGATVSLATKINYLYKAWRNRKTQTATETRLYNDDGTTIGQKAAVSDNGTTFESGEVTTGP